MMLYWLFIGIALIFFELMTLSFFLLFFGLAALTVAAALAFLLIPLVWQIFLFSVLALIYCLIGKTLAKKKSCCLQETDYLVGTQATVISNICPKNSGTVLVGDTLWMAKSSFTLQKGDKVHIVSVIGLTLEVAPL